MLDHVLNFAKKEANFDAIFLHVQINNDGAIEFYKKFGFEIVETKQHYYKRIEPADAHVLQKCLKPSSGTIPLGISTGPSQSNGENESPSGNPRDQEAWTHVPLRSNLA